MYGFPIFSCLGEYEYHYTPGPWRHDEECSRYEHFHVNCQDVLHYVIKNDRMEHCTVGEDGQPSALANNGIAVDMQLAQVLKGEPAFLVPSTEELRASYFCQGCGAPSVGMLKCKYCGS